MSSTLRRNKTKWDQVFSFVLRSPKKGVTADEIVQRTGWKRSTVSSYLTLFTQEGYAIKTDQMRKITSGRMAHVYIPNISSRQNSGSARPNN